MKIKIIMEIIRAYERSVSGKIAAQRSTIFFVNPAPRSVPALRPSAPRSAHAPSFSVTSAHRSAPAPSCATHTQHYSALFNTIHHDSIAVLSKQVYLFIYLFI